MTAKSTVNHGEKQKLTQQALGLLAKHGVPPKRSDKCNIDDLRALAKALQVSYRAKWSRVDAIRELSAISDQFGAELDSPRQVVAPLLSPPPTDSIETLATCTTVCINADANL